MHVTRLALTDFRSYAAADLRLEPGVSTLLGANGQGKTNLVEAVAYVATLGSHRAAADAPLVRSGADRAIVRAEISSAARDSLVEIEINPGRANRARLNRSPLTRPRQVIGVLRAVLFAPEDLALVKGEPDQRRRFLDDLLAAGTPRYARVRADYERVLRQRTALLKSLRARGPAAGRRRVTPVPAGSAENASTGADEQREPLPGGGAETGAGPRGGRPGLPGHVAHTLEIWDEHLARAGAELVAARLELAASLRPLVARSYAAVSGGDPAVGITYRQSLPGSGGTGDRSAGHGHSGSGEPAPDPELLAGSLREAMKSLREQELERGVCLVGPHRDDLELRVGGLPARGYASQGESWSMALALRLAAYDLLCSMGERPVLLLDDVFAELDSGRRERLAALVAGADQVLVTAAVAADVPVALRGARFEVSAGTVSRA